MTRPASPSRPVPRPPTWLLALGWVLAGLGWLAYPNPLTFVCFGVFAASQVWWALSAKAGQR